MTTPVMMKTSCVKCNSVPRFAPHLVVHDIWQMLRQLQCHLKCAELKIYSETHATGYK